MITLISAFIGFVSSAFPDILKMFRDAADREHEITILKLQLEQQKQGASERLEEIHSQSDAQEITALYKTYTVGIGWVDVLNGTVRPVIAYAFFLLYALVKANQMQSTPWLLWTEEDQAIFAGIISFYFGSRAMAKARK